MQGISGDEADERDAREARDDGLESEERTSKADADKRRVGSREYERVDWLAVWKRAYELARR
ncbi:MAG: hypothetical protein IPJ65_39305 [Archangiaceae bacterium]|nr:hypothetical protein [Archangiaceae bacterium]